LATASVIAETSSGVPPLGDAEPPSGVGDPGVAVSELGAPGSDSVVDELGVVVVVEVDVPLLLERRFRADSPSSSLLHAPPMSASAPTTMTTRAPRPTIVSATYRQFLHRGWRGDGDAIA
jgi:hypothetical protein